MSKEKRWSRRRALGALAAAPAVLLFRSGEAAPADGDAGTGDAGDGKAPAYDQDEHYWGYAVDTTKCIGCNACMRACAAENDVPDGVFRTWVERYRVSEDGETRVDAATEGNHVFREVEDERPEAEAKKAFFVPKICNHCEKSVCNQVCPVGAAYETRDGLVLVDQEHCIGCGYCVQACPYGSRFIHPVKHVADKCTFCYHRISRGLEPACVAACPTGTRMYGDLKDPHSRLSTILRQGRFRLLKPEMGTHPKCFYLGLDREVV